MTTRRHVETEVDRRDVWERIREADAANECLRAALEEARRTTQWAISELTRLKAEHEAARWDGSPAPLLGVKIATGGSAMPDPSNHPSFYNDTRGFTVDDVNLERPDHAPEDFDCPHCGVPAGVRCRAPWGTERIAHAERFDMAREAKS